MKRLYVFMLIHVVFATVLLGQTKKRELAAKRVDFSWLKVYQNRTTNAVAWDKRFKALKNHVIPERKVRLFGYSCSLQEAFHEGVSGPPDDVLFNKEKNTVVLSGCRQHSCDEKALMWIDLNFNKGLIAIVHYSQSGNPRLYIASKNFVRLSDIPNQAYLDIKTWLKNKELNIPQEKWQFNP